MQEETGEEADVFSAFTQRRDVDADDIEPVKKVFAEFPLLDILFQIAIGGGDDADIRLHRLIATDAGVFPLLEHAENLALQGHGHVANFIQKEGSSIALLEAPLALGLGPGKGAFFMAEEFAFQQVFRNGGAIDGDKFLLGTR